MIWRYIFCILLITFQLHLTKIKANNFTIKISDDLTEDEGGIVVKVLSPKKNYMTCDNVNDRMELYFPHQIIGFTASTYGTVYSNSEKFNSLLNFTIAWKEWNPPKEVKYLVNFHYLIDYYAYQCGLSNFKKSDVIVDSPFNIYSKSSYIFSVPVTSVSVLDSSFIYPLHLLGLMGNIKSSIDPSTVSDDCLQYMNDANDLTILNGTDYTHDKDILSKTDLVFTPSNLENIYGSNEDYSNIIPAYGAAFNHSYDIEYYIDFVNILGFYFNDEYDSGDYTDGFLFSLYVYQMAFSQMYSYIRSDTSKYGYDNFALIGTDVLEDGTPIYVWINSTFFNSLSSIIEVGFEIPRSSVVFSDNLGEAVGANYTGKKYPNGSYYYLNSTVFFTIFSSFGIKTRLLIDLDVYPSYDDFFKGYNFDTSILGSNITSYPFFLYDHIYTVDKLYAPDRKTLDIYQRSQFMSPLLGRDLFLAAYSDCDGFLHDYKKLNAKTFSKKKKKEIIYKIQKADRIWLRRYLPDNSDPINVYNYSSNPSKKMIKKQCEKFDPYIILDID